MQLDLQLNEEQQKVKKNEKVKLMCKNCEHSCHCGNGGKCSSCECLNCEHNALDDFHYRLNNGKEKYSK